MTKTRIPSKQLRRSKNDDLFARAHRLWKRGELRPALELFLAAAKAGDPSSQVNVGYFYDRGIGVRPNRSAALYWYKRAYRRGDASAANNIATIWRDQQQPRRALFWFRRAVEQGDDGSNLEIAKHYFRTGKDPKKAVTYLNKVCRSNSVTEAEAAEAKRLLRKLKGKSKSAN